MRCRQAAPPGRPIVVWGIRARHAPMITMLAFAPDSRAQPVVVERVYWRLLGRAALDQAQRVAVAGAGRGAARSAAAGRGALRRILRRG